MDWMDNADGAREFLREAIIASTYVTDGERYINADLDPGVALELARTIALVSIAESLEAKRDATE